MAFLKYSKQIIASSIICVLLLTATGSVRSEKKKEDIEPSQLYEIVYLLVQQGFYKRSFNNQDFSIWAYDNRYKGLLNDYDDSTKAIQTMLASLGDRYTRYLDRKEYQEEIEAINAKLKGIGIQIGLNKEMKVVVISPIQGTPAFKAGLLPKDEILEVDGEETKGLSIEEVAKRIRGLPDTEVTIKVDRAGQEKTFVVKRAEIHVESIPENHYKHLTDDICYLHLTSFIAQDADNEFLDRLKKLGECPALIVDLRNNPGGLLNNAISISSIFLEPGMDIVSTVDRDGYVETKSLRFLEKPSFKYEGELVVLVNGGSASASEILSGALRDNGRAVLVGDKTFGKGLVQVVRELPDGSGLNLTAAKYLTPNGSDIHEIGIEPHYKVKLTPDQIENKQGPWFIDFDNVVEGNINIDKDLQLAEALEIAQKKLDSKAKMTSSTKAKQLVSSI